MTSEHVTELISAYIDDELTSDEVQRVEAHLEECDACQHELEQLRQTVGYVRSLPQLELPMGFRSELRQQLLAESLDEERVGQKEEPKISWIAGLMSRISLMGRRTWVGAAVAAVVILALVVVVVPDGLDLDRQLAEDGAPRDYGVGDSAVPESAPKVGQGEPAAPKTDGAEGDYVKVVPPPTKEGSQQYSSLGQQAPGQFEHRVIRTAQLEVEVEDAPKAYQQVVVMAESMGGFVQQSSQREDGERMTANLIIRVPEGRFGEAIQEVNDLGHVRNQQMSGQNVTEEFVDLQSRIKTMQAKEDRLVQILGEAKSVDEILKVEREVWSVRENIEQLQGRLRYLDNMTSLSTLQINLYEPKTAPPTQEPETLWDQIVEAFVDSIQYMGYYLGRLLILLSWVLPYAIGVIVLGLIVRFGLSRRGG